MHEPQAIPLAFLVAVVAGCLSAAAADWIERVLARPRLRPVMLWKMFRLARQNYNVVTAYYLARTFELATRPKAGP